MTNRSRANVHDGYRITERPTDNPYTILKQDSGVHFVFDDNDQAFVLPDSDDDNDVVGSEYWIGNPSSFTGCTVEPGGAVDGIYYMDVLIAGNTLYPAIGAEIHLLCTGVGHWVVLSPYGMCTGKDKVLSAYYLTDTCGWAWENQGGATLTDGESSPLLNIPASGTDSVRQLYLAVPSTSYQLTVHLAYFGDTSNWRHMGIGWKAAVGSATANLELLTMWLDAGAWALNLFRWDDETTYGATTVLRTGVSVPDVWLRIKETGGNIYLYYSLNGSGWYQLSTYAKGAYSGDHGLGASDYDYLIIGGNESSTSNAFGIEILHYELVDL